MTGDSWKISRLRWRYGSLSRDDYSELLQAALKGNDSDSGLKQVVLEEGLELRPGTGDCAPDDMRWKYWAALAMRFFPALRPNGQTNTIASVRDWLEHDRALTQVLLFGESTAICEVLRQGFEEDAWRDNLPAETPGQALILDIVRYHLSSTNLSERQVGNWSLALLEEWVDRLADRLQVRALRSLASLVERLVLRLGGRDSLADPAMFKQYMERFREAGLDWAYGQALGYHNELKRRYRQAARSAAWVMAGGLSGAFCTAVAVAARLLEAHYVVRLMSVAAALIALGAVVIHLVRIVFVLGFAPGNVETQLATLEEIEASYLEKT